MWNLKGKGGTLQKEPVLSSLPSCLQPTTHAGLSQAPQEQPPWGPSAVVLLKQVADATSKRGTSPLWGRGGARALQGTLREAAGCGDKAPFPGCHLRMLWASSGQGQWLFCKKPALERGLRLGNSAALPACA